MGTLVNIKEAAKRNENFRKVVLTGKYGQLVLMSLHPGEDIGEEIHPEVDQMFFMVEGKAHLVMDGKPYVLDEHDVVLVPAGVKHNLTNTSRKAIKLYTVYSPPTHPAGEIEKSRPELVAKK